MSNYHIEEKDLYITKKVDYMNDHFIANCIPFIGLAANQVFKICLYL